jgi:hypothetical protein
MVRNIGLDFLSSSPSRISAAIRSLTTAEVGADNGNAAKTLTVGMPEIQRWNTALTADRAVTLSTTGAANGDWFRIVRGAGATGSFNLNVGTGPLKALAAASTWCEVRFDGTAWVLTASGTL